MKRPSLAVSVNTSTRSCCLHCAIFTVYYWREESSSCLDGMSSMASMTLTLKWVGGVTKCGRFHGRCVCMYVRVLLISLTSKWVSQLVDFPHFKCECLSLLISLTSNATMWVCTHKCVLASINCLCVCVCVCVCACVCVRDRNGLGSQMSNLHRCSLNANSTPYRSSTWLGSWPYGGGNAWQVVNICIAQLMKTWYFATS